jgi:phosphopantothenoylcysteine decarboxylase/phosphopantothenate--cysteine ligase
MADACISRAEAYDIAIMAAAVADYTPVTAEAEKIKKTDEEFNLKLKRTKDILGSLGKIKSDNQILVGFALETTNEEQFAQKKLRDKNADLIVLNSLREKGAGFGHDTNKVNLYFKNGGKLQLELKSKTSIAKDIVDSICGLIQ